MKTRFVALLRGINVAAANRIRMDALRRLFEEAGFTGTETYIQSGNVLFDAEEPEEAVRQKIALTLKTDAGIETTVVLRTDAELSELIARCPFSADEIEAAKRVNAEAESFHVCLLPQPPARTALDALAAVSPEGDRLVVVGRDVYLLLCRSIRLSKLAIRMQKIFPEGTVRNWNTISKLCELANAEPGGGR
ncbi:MAG: DUF1697 domain-containing protein [Clostridiales bacterium]|nr:DUF1697 domain-containing protein [Clostridiales bacterium]